MMDAATAKGWSPRDEDEADALWILDYANYLIKSGPFPP